MLESSLATANNALLRVEQAFEEQLGNAGQNTADDIASTIPLQTAPLKTVPLQTAPLKTVPSPTVSVDTSTTSSWGWLRLSSLRVFNSVGQYWQSSDHRTRIKGLPWRAARTWEKLPAAKGRTLSMALAGLMQTSASASVRQRNAAFNGNPGSAAENSKPVFLFIRMQI